MPNPEVRYCTTEDGVRIAYTVTGQGPPLLLRTDQVASHVQLEWSMPTISRLLERLASQTMLIRLDPRGVGMSDRILPSTLDEAALDIEAVVSRLGIDSFAVVAVQGAAMGVIAYLARHAEHVSRVVFVNGYLRVRDALATPQVRAILGAAAGDFVIATEAISALAFGTGREESVAFGAYIRSCIGPEYFARAAQIGSEDVAAYIPSLTMPTLAVRHEGLKFVTPEMTRDLVAGLPDARLVVLPGIPADDPERLADHIVAFVNDEEYVEGTDRIATTPQSVGLQTVFFTDLVGHTEMMRRLGDEKGRDILREHERITREALAAHGGAEVKTMGDGFMASFSSVTKAMDCAIALQRAFAAHEGEPLDVRVGLNAGEPIEEEGDLFGSTVILASRIAAQAGAGEILIPEPLRHLLSGKSYVYADRGEVAMKGFEEAVRLYEVKWRDA